MPTIDNAAIVKAQIGIGNNFTPPQRSPAELEAERKAKGRPPMGRQMLAFVLMSSAAKKRFFLRGALNPQRMPQSKTISPAKEAELARRTAERDAKPPKPK